MPSTTAIETSRINADLFQERVTFEKSIGIVLLDIGINSAITEITITQALLNFHGSAHGGLIFSLADSAFAYACNSKENITMGIGCSIEYLKPAFIGDKLSASAKIYIENGRHGIYHVQVKNQNDDEVAVFTGKSLSTNTPILGA